MNENKSNKCFVRFNYELSIMYWLIDNLYTTLHIVTYHTNEVKINTSDKFRQLLNFKEMPSDERKGYYATYGSLKEAEGFLVDNLKKNAYSVIGSEYLIYE